MNHSEYLSVLSVFLLGICESLTVLLSFCWGLRLDDRHIVIQASFRCFEVGLVRTKAMFPINFLSTQFAQSTLKKKKEFNNKVWLVPVRLPENWDLYGFH